MRPRLSLTPGEIISRRDGSPSGFRYLAEEEKRGRERRALVECHCGARWVTTISNIRSGSTKSCGCAWRLPLGAGDPIQRSDGSSSMLIFLAEEPSTPNHHNGGSSRNVKVECRCGVEFVTALAHVRSGGTTSCGCEKRRITSMRRRTHGESIDGSTPLYVKWSSMRERTTPGGYVQRKKPSYVGIGRDPRWEDYEEFKKDVGDWWFPGASFGRMRRELDGSWIYDDGDYVLGNVCWIEVAENTRQMHAQRSNKPHTPPPDVIARWEAMTANASQAPATP